jgi:hypothetical protein
MFQLIKIVVKLVIRTFVLLIVAGIAVIYGWITAGHDRADMIAFYELSHEEAEAYDSCRKALSGHKLKNGGSKTEFCGCYAKKGTEMLAAGHKTLSARYIEAAAEKNVERLAEELPDGSTVDGVSSMDATQGVLQAFSQCAAEVDYSCRSGDAACKETVRERKAHRDERMKMVRAARENGETMSRASPEVESPATEDELGATTAEAAVAAAEVPASGDAAPTTDLGHLLPEP